jgi:hypothetical protein
MATYGLHDGIKKQGSRISNSSTHHNQLYVDQMSQTDNTEAHSTASPVNGSNRHLIPVNRSPNHVTPANGTILNRITNKAGFSSRDLGQHPGSYIGT